MKCPGGRRGVWAIRKCESSIGKIAFSIADSENKEKKENSGTIKAKPKRGRGNEKQTKVLVMVESKPTGKDAKKASQIVRLDT